MEIVIDIEQELYEEILSRKYSKTRIEKAVANGIPLPKGHGDLMDKNNLITITDISADGIEFTYVPYSEIEDAPTIIEADISGKE